MNWNFCNALERWCLFFAPIFVPIDLKCNRILSEYSEVQLFFVASDKMIIYHNAKMKYRCLHCMNEWTTARGRITFQAETPKVNKYNFLYVNLCTQHCRLCGTEIEPSCYLNEVTRVMKNICQILIEQFYPNRNFVLPLPPSSTSEEDFGQRIKQPRGPHQQHLCRACREGFCYSSTSQYYR